MADTQQETLYAMALTRICHFSFAAALTLYRKLGSAAAVHEHRADIRDVCPECSTRLADHLRHWDDALALAEEELSRCQAAGVTILTPSCSGYPQRLAECADAPLVLYYKGTGNLNCHKVVSVVGTRHCTAYGRAVIQKFCEDLRKACPEALVVSGLAYGVDVCAHRAALACGFETVGVLAHGLDSIYPPSHAGTANEMLSHGGLLTEFMLGTRPEKANFVWRNRIVAGMADALVLVESAARGGGLITVNMARGYGRDVFAFPGPVTAPFSEGCNNSIRDNMASLVTCAGDLVKAMRWDDDERLRQARTQGIGRVLFPVLGDEEQRVVNLLSQTNDLHTDTITLRTGLSVSTVATALFQLELKGMVRPYAGGVYHLLN